MPLKYTTISTRRGRDFNRLVCAQTGPVTDNATANVRARGTEPQMRDKERFTLLSNLMKIKGSSGKSHKCVPGNTNQGADYAAGVPPHGLPAT